MRVSRQHLKTILTVDISSCCFRRCTPERHVLISPNVKRGNANGTDTSLEVDSATPLERGGRRPPRPHHTPPSPLPIPLSPPHPPPPPPPPPPHPLPHPPLSPP